MSEVTRFRVVRSPRRLAEDPRAILRVLRSSAEPTYLVSALRQLVDASPPMAMRAMAISHEFDLDTWPQDVASTVQAARVDALPATAEMMQVRRLVERFDDALLRYVPAPTAARCEDLIAGIAQRLDLDIATPAGEPPSSRVLSQPGWVEEWADAGDALVAAVMLRAVGETAAPEPEDLTRRMLVMGLIDALADPIMTIDTDDDVAALLFRRTVLLPSPPFPLSKFAPLRARYARKPGIMDLEVIRDEWSCFVPGEIAFIENVMKGENKSRTHKQLDEIETTTSREETGTTSQEQASQTTDRFQFEEEARKETAVAVTVSGQVDVSASYGAVKIEAKAGADASLSFEDSSSRTTQTAKEIVERAVSRVESQVRETRATRTLFRSLERDHHEFENRQANADNVAGIYRWVDKVKRIRSFTYPMRYVLEFELAEPGARLRWLQARRKEPEGLVSKPPAFTLTGQPGAAGDINAELAPTQITRDNYTDLVGMFMAQGVKEPPSAAIDIAGAIQLATKATPPTGAYDWVEQIPAANGSVNLGIPPGYKATYLRAALVAAPQLASWKDVPDQTSNYYSGVTGYHAIVAGVTAGNARLTLQNGVPTVFASPDATEGYEYQGAWDFPYAKFEDEVELDQEMIGQVTVSATIAGTFTGHVTVALGAELLSSAFEQWQLDTFDQLAQAHQNWQTRYDSDQQAREATGGIGLVGDSSTKNRIRVIEEIRRQIIELLMGSSFAGYPLMLQPPDPSTGPNPNFRTLARVTPTIQFIEQAFEWNNITYITYPFYWTDRVRWPELEELRANDADFEAFVRAGSARVVVPARPGYQHAVEYFATFGAPWSGGAAPAPDDPLYVSVAQEIRDLTGAPDDGVPGEMWEVKQPTTLVWLDNDSTLPKKNTALPTGFKGTPHPQICPD